MSKYVIADIMSRKPVSIHPEATLQDAALLMREKGVGSLLVHEENKLSGIITEWDFVHKAAAMGVDMTNTHVKDYAMGDLLTVSPAMDLFAALRLMRDADIEHLPVMEEEKLVGYVTIKDILKIEPQLIELLTEQQMVSSFEDQDLQLQ